METMEYTSQDPFSPREQRDVWNTFVDGNLAQPIRNASLPSKNSPTVQGRQMILDGDSILRRIDGTF